MSRRVVARCVNLARRWSSVACHRTVPIAISVARAWSRGSLSRLRGASIALASVVTSVFAASKISYAAIRAGAITGCRPDRRPTRLETVASKKRLGRHRAPPLALEFEDFEGAAGPCRHDEALVGHQDHPWRGIGLGRRDRRSSDHIPMSVEVCERVRPRMQAPDEIVDVACLARPVDDPVGSHDTTGIGRLTEILLLLCGLAREKPIYRLDEQGRAEHRQGVLDGVAGLVRADRPRRLGQHRAGVQFPHEPHDRHASLVLAGDDGPMDRRRTAVRGKE